MLNSANNGEVNLKPGWIVVLFYRNKKKDVNYLKYFCTTDMDRREQVYR